MNLHNTVSEKMQYIQKLFMDVQDFMQQPVELSVLISFLDSELPEFRSIAYESASMNIALHDLKQESPLEKWKDFYALSGAKHAFHMQIGLGWAFAKAAIDPHPWFQILPLVHNEMIYDGIGYYHALFNGRRTIKSQLIPGSLEALNRDGFDQGLGRRLWYTVMGDPEQLKRYLDLFMPGRKPALWKGIGIACGYVGGCDKLILKNLIKYSSENKDQLSRGIRLALFSRQASGSITPDIELACKIVCEQTVHSVFNESDFVFNQSSPIT